ncbi:RNA methyltransferase [Flavitalea sp. BT771]|uniref:methyltransferase RsmF C-terminal domain-like protein n=1 Tax=Flavitalea sp. BT771 TaxID=3063329 RepID=UPI0026E1E327|nr:RNA methyltransferase [Flavitalea sp. BT771]MDO6429848.1 RNA methyltransferase [Flavitalea sp. BT771]MDV6218024.1 RNA methyltransferase [Flavitalea sp. BT771]
MPDLPKLLMDSLQGAAGFDAAAFEAVHASGAQVTSVRLNPAKWPGDGETHEWSSDVGMEKIPWSTWGYYLSKRPSFTFDPLFHAGAYYVQEASSMFLEQVLRQSADLSRPLRVLDLCAAPGGKSTLIRSLLPEDSLLVSNEVIRSRAGILQENMIKWGAAGVVVTNNDPRDLGRLENYFDVIVVDAPCSGSGLFRREPEAIDEWSLDNVQLCHQRQQRILADIWPALRSDGLLIYSTCSYSKEEDEEILDWMMEELQATSCRLQVGADWNIVETQGDKGGYGYRFYPDKVKGEGFFIAAVRKNEGNTFSYPRSKKQGFEKLPRKEADALGPWITERSPLLLFRHEEMVRALPASMAEDLNYLQSYCYLKKAGVLLGQPSVKDFIPDHELALSDLIHEQLPAIELSREEAINYLRKEELQAASGRLQAVREERRGWSLVRYQGQNLGWVKVLPNRVNNYYPKEWRILKRP